MKSVKSIKTVLVSGLVATGMAAAGFSGAVVAQPPSAITPAGPIAINGYVSVNNTAKTGGLFTDFRCKVEGWGFIENANPAVVRIDFLRPLNESSGQIPRGCHGVEVLVPMEVVLGSMPTPVGTLLSTTDVTVSNVTFQAQNQPGCGTSTPATITTAGGGTVTWEESNPLAPPPNSENDNTHTRLVFNNAIVDEGGPNCLISGALKFSRWSSIHAQP